MKPMKIMLALLVTSILGWQIVSAHVLDDTTPEYRAYAYRDSVMHTITTQRTILRDMAEGKRDTDITEFTRAAEALSALIGIIPGVFSQNAIVDESLAKPEIWANWDDFVAKADDLKKVVDEIARLAANNRIDDAKVMVEDIGCGGCHREYKVDTD